MLCSETRKGVLELDASLHRWRLGVVRTKISCERGARAMEMGGWSEEDWLWEEEDPEGVEGLEGEERKKRERRPEEEL